MQTGPSVHDGSELLAGNGMDDDSGCCGVVVRVPLYRESGESCGPELPETRRASSIWHSLLPTHDVFPLGLTGN